MLWEPDFTNDYFTRANPTLEDHETELLDAVMQTFTDEQWHMFEQYDWLELWFQDFANHQNGVN